MILYRESKRKLIEYCLGTKKSEQLAGEEEVSTALCLAKFQLLSREKKEEVTCTRSRLGGQALYTCSGVLSCIGEKRSQERRLASPSRKGLAPFGRQLPGSPDLPLTPPYLGVRHLRLGDGGRHSCSGRSPAAQDALDRGPPEGEPAGAPQPSLQHVIPVRISVANSSDRLPFPFCWGADPGTALFLWGANGSCIGRGERPSHEDQLQRGGLLFAGDSHVTQHLYTH